MNSINRIIRRSCSSSYKKISLYTSYNNSVKSKWSQNDHDVLSCDNLIFPVFVSAIPSESSELKHLTKNYRVGKDKILQYLDPLIKQGLSSVLLFGNIESNFKDSCATHSCHPTNPVIQSIPLLKKAFPGLNVICDVCLCAYTKTGQCYIEDESGEIDNLKSITRLAETALAFAQAGCDIVAPSDMIDNRVSMIKEFLSKNKLQTSIMSYSGKLASCFYGPFRDAADSYCSTPSRRNQLPIGSDGLIMRGIDRDIKEGADFIIIKPGLHGLDMISRAKNQFPDYPLFAYHVSGECAMLNYASQNGAIDFKKALLETMTSFKRSGTTGVITYFVPHLLEMKKLMQ